MKMTNASGAALAAAAATIFISGAAVSAQAAGTPKMGHCMTANACKGLSACKGGAPGLNGCKGQGFAILTEAACKKAGFKFEPM